MSRTKKDSPSCEPRCGQGPPSYWKRMMNHKWRRKLNRELQKEEPQLVQHRNEGKWSWF